MKPLTQSQLRQRSIRTVQALLRNAHLSLLSASSDRALVAGAEAKIRELAKRLSELQQPNA